MHATTFALNLNIKNQYNKNGKIEEEVSIDVKESEHKKRVGKYFSYPDRHWEKQCKRMCKLIHNDNNNRKIILYEQQVYVDEALNEIEIFENHKLMHVQSGCKIENYTKNASDMSQ